MTRTHFPTQGYGKRLAMQEAGAKKYVERAGRIAELEVQVELQSKLKDDLNGASAHWNENFITPAAAKTAAEETEKTAKASVDADFERAWCRIAPAPATLRRTVEGAR